MFDIQDQLKKLPAEPGVYLMKDENDKITIFSYLTKLLTVILCL